MGGDWGLEVHEKVRPLKDSFRENVVPNIGVGGFLNGN